MTNEVKQVGLSGSSTTVISHAATLTTTSWTYSGLTGCTMVTLDNSSLLYPYGLAVLDIPDTFSAAPTADSVVELWMTRQDVDSTSDVIPASDSGGLKQAELVGVFRMVAFDVATRVAIVISLLGVTKANFMIRNQSGVSLTYSSNAITVKITPFSLGPT